MFEATRMLFIYVETPLHAGTGRGLGAVDQPIQRERTTNYPIVQASSIKGRLRAEAKGKIPDPEHQAIFGPEAGSAAEHAGALSAGDARLLLFPVRSLAGVFAWVTSSDALARFQREAALVNLPLRWEEFSGPQPEEAWVSDKCTIKVGEKKTGETIVLEEFSFTPKQDKAVETIGAWIATHALPQTSEYAYWQKALPQKLCILHEDTFRDFVQYSTEVQTHVRLDPEKKTAQPGALWTSESLPVDTILYVPLMATKSRMSGISLSAGDVLQRITHLNLTRTQLGGDETTGQGMVALRFTGDDK